MVESWLRRLVETPKRALIVMILTCGIGLLLGGPAADDYFALGNHRAQLEKSLEQARQQVGELKELERRAARSAQSLAALESQTVSEDGVHDFRSELVELTRRSGCRLRRIDLEAARRRKWREEDHPLETPPTGKSVSETPYTLRSQRIGLSVSGTLGNVNELLNALQAVGKMIHTKNFSLRPVGEQRTEVFLDLDLIVFDLETSPPTGT